MYIVVNTIMTAASVIPALAVIFTAIFAGHRCYLRQDQQNKEIEIMKAEQCLLTYGILACLKGLTAQRCNGPVAEAIQKIKNLLISRHIIKKNERKRN